MSEMWKPEVIGLEVTDRPSKERVPPHLRKQIAVLEPEGPLFFGVADTIYRQVDRLVHFKVLIISLRNVPVVDLSGAFALEDMVELAKKRGTKVIVKGMNPAVRRTLTELSVIKHIGEENIVEHFDQALDIAVDYLADRYLGERRVETEGQPLTPSAETT